MFQVTEDSGGFHTPNRGEYWDNTSEGIADNVSDATGSFNMRLGEVRAGDPTTAFLADLPDADYVRAALRYNGGDDPIANYMAGMGDPSYLGRLAHHMEMTLPQMFEPRYGYVLNHQGTQTLIAALWTAQDRVTASTGIPFRPNW
jgi:hypothetical protein